MDGSINHRIFTKEISVSHSNPMVSSYITVTMTTKDKEQMLWRCVTSCRTKVVIFDPCTINVMDLIWHKPWLCVLLFLSWLCYSHSAPFKWFKALTASSLHSLTDCTLCDVRSLSKQPREILVTLQQVCINRCLRISVALEDLIFIRLLHRLVFLCKYLCI